MARDRSALIGDCGVPEDGNHEFALTVEEAHLDSLNHVNNARFFEFFEAGRMAWYHEVGLIAQCRQSVHPRCDTVVVNVTCDFLNECYLGENLVVQTRPDRVGRKSFAVTQRLLKPEGIVAAEAVVTSVVMDLNARRAIVLPTSVLALFGADRDGGLRRSSLAHGRACFPVVGQLGNFLFNSTSKARIALRGPVAT